MLSLETGYASLLMIGIVQHSIMKGYSQRMMMPGASVAKVDERGYDPRLSLGWVSRRQSPVELFPREIMWRTFREKLPGRSLHT
jgi:hypothetical protein